MAPLPPPPLPAEPGPEDALGLYLAVPFCASKCSYCNFASQVFPAAVYLEYCELLAREISLAAAADGLAGVRVDSIYWGGGTPSLLPPAGWTRVVAAIHRCFAVDADCEHTVEVAPGTLRPAVLDAFASSGVNRLSFGAQSFHDAELRAVGRLHRASTVLDDLASARRAGIANLSLDLIAGLPHQTRESWQTSVAAAVDTGVPHMSLYMLEVDEDSRLGNELLAGGARYHAHTVPDDDLIADAYEWACEHLDHAGLPQYEISNFARPGGASRHNERYWLRRPYLGCGLDAHSFLPGPPARRFANPDSLDGYCAPLRSGRLPRLPAIELTAAAEREERYFLGLRRTAGIAVSDSDPQIAAIPALVADGLLARPAPGRIALTARGRMLSNRVLAEFLEPCGLNCDKTVTI